jgi:hypothetical protein
MFALRAYYFFIITRKKIMKYRLIFKSAAALDIQISSVTKGELRDMYNNIDDAEQLFYHALGQGYEADIYNAIGVPADNYRIEVFELNDFGAEIGDAICVFKTGDLQLQLIDEKINANPGDIIIGSVTNGRGVCGHIDVQMETFEVSKISIIQTNLSDFGAESLCFKIALDNGAIEKYIIQHDLYLDIMPKVELVWLSIIGLDKQEKSLFDEYSEYEGWNKTAVEAVLADKGGE